MATLKREIVEEDIPRIHELVKIASKNQNGGVLKLSNDLTISGTFNPTQPAGTVNYDPEAEIVNIERLGGMTNHSYKVTLENPAKSKPKPDDYSGAPEPVNPIFRATLSAWQNHSE